MSTFIEYIHAQYLYQGQKIIDISDEHLPTRIAKIIHQFVTQLPIIGCLMVTPVKLQLACSAIYIVTQGLDCNDSVCAKSVAAVSCTFLLKAMANLYRLSCSCTLATVAVVVLQTAAAYAGQEILSLLKISDTYL